MRTIASGGMAQVYEAVLVGDHGFERRVAVKRILPQHMHDASLCRMFFDEARVASQLHHGGIVQVLDYGVVDGAQFITMEYVDGVDAARASRQGALTSHPIPVGVALHIASEVAHALHYAHTCADGSGAALDIVHRDISPQNILLSWEGDVKLSDFGIAQAVAREEKTRTGVVKGKLGYMAPEQASGQRVTAAADVYALGQTLEVLLRCDPSAWGGQVREERPAVQWASPEVLALLARCQAADPDGRPSSMELAETAGHLAAAALRRDTRGALRDWLLPMRDALKRRSVLDDVIGLSLVAIGQRQFTVSRAAQGSTSPLGSVEGAAPSAETAAGAAESETRLERPGDRVSRRWWLAPALAAGLGAAFVLVYVLGTGQRSPAPPADRAADRTRDGGARADGARHLTAARVLPTPSSRPTTQPTPPPIRTVAGGRAASTRVARARRPGSRRARVKQPRRRPGDRGSSVSPAVEPDATRRGWLRVGGAALARGKVAIDGRGVGYAPLERELPLGVHSVQVKDVTTGRVLIETRVVIGEQHTRANAVRLIR